MSLKAELETWAAALKAYDEQDFEKALDLFSVRTVLSMLSSMLICSTFQRIADSSKILTNMGLIYATLGEHEAAVERFIEATNLDQYLAVAYVINVILDRCFHPHYVITDTFNAEFPTFCLVATTSLSRILSRPCFSCVEIRRCEFCLFVDRRFFFASSLLMGSNYEQLGLKFRLFSAEVLYNKGLSLIYMGRLDDGMQDMYEASKDKAIDDHKVIDEAIQDRGEGYMVFSVVRRPPFSLSCFF
jgi:tetratricopeptide (TPR) repeat protein